ncbi:tetratricopeptide (TPR) repeat protein/DNA-binding CsgD family transcriptional regulator [Catalinimonas alkaloidigena]|uniref:hypothetical protein n=1 Tax=Catalinimonas alkaloidigena TaxID=1075417 RepID=UPI002405D25B|nr:hypothetical protein [Catalinimonas alkaloidigena]MDF9796471.1 tetratricopeptide (TPR) repeat protein/DNA-binding CsgD family transcriptional regulator [Catalinimonas alkaloidigena]
MYRKFIYRLWVSLILIACPQLSSALSPDEEQPINAEDYVISLSFIKESLEDSIIKNMKDNIESLLSDGDTIQAIQQMIKLSQLYSNRVDFNSAYDNYWDALLLAEEANHLSSQAWVYEGLGILYSIYERPIKAHENYRKALQICKSLVRKQEADSTFIRKIYFSLAVHYRYEENLDLASAYLDSCKAISTTNLIAAKLDAAESGYQEIMRGNYDTAEEQLLPLKNDFSEIVPSYLVVYHSMLGELYAGMQEHELAVSHYYQALAYAKENLSHLNFIPIIYRQLSDITSRLEKEKEAQLFLRSAYELEEWLYSIKSPNNRFLVEIKDKYRASQEAQASLIQAQRVQQLEQAEYIWYLKTLILIISLIFVGFAAVSLIYRMRKKHKLKQALLEQKREQETQKNKEILQIKNKELTNSTLQLIAKDELLNEIKTELIDMHKESKEPELKRVITNIKLNKEQNWLAFENRFNSVNNDFFERLKEKFPKLKPYDLKICALIKLDFSGKEMAQLLGITPESANTSRYRLRKRLGLEKQDNLKEFIDRI